MSNSVLLVTSLLFFVLFLIQTFRIRKLYGRSSGEKNSATEEYVKPKSHRVSYLEPKVTDKISNRTGKTVGSSHQSSNETADSVLGINVTTTAGADSTAVDEAEYSYEDQIDIDIQDRWIVLFLQAEQDKFYGGYELLQAILSSGLRYGENNVFHCYESNTSKGKALFHLASAIQPGTFDLPNMGGFSTPALTVFFNVKDVTSPAAVLEKMLHVVGQLSDDLGGKVLDESKILLSKEKVREVYLEINQIEKNMSNFDLFSGTEQQV